MPIGDVGAIPRNWLGDIANFLAEKGVINPQKKFTLDDFDALMEGIEGASRGIPPQYQAPLLGATFTGKHALKLLRRMDDLPQSISEGVRFAMAKYPRISSNVKKNWWELVENYPSKISGFLESQNPSDARNFIADALATANRGNVRQTLRSNAQLAAKNYRDFIKALDEIVIPGVPRMQKAMQKTRNKVDMDVIDYFSDLIDPKPTQRNVDEVFQSVMSDFTFGQRMPLSTKIFRNNFSTFSNNILTTTREFKDLLGANKTNELFVGLREILQKYRKLDNPDRLDFIAEVGKYVGENTKMLEQDQYEDFIRGLFKDF